MPGPDQSTSPPARFDPAWGAAFLTFLLGLPVSPADPAEPAGTAAVAERPSASLRPLSLQDVGEGRTRAEFLSPVYTVDRVYRSMKGPTSTQDIVVLPDEPNDWIWITGYHAEVVGADGRSPVSQEFMCHSNLDFAGFPSHAPSPRQAAYKNIRVFTLSQGQTDIEFPDGFGIPLRGREPLRLTTQVLNNNLVGETVRVRHRVAITFRRHGSLRAPMRPLFERSAFSLALVSGADGYYNVPKPDADAHGPGCLPGLKASDHQLQDQQGRTFTGHWVVKPGRQENRTLVTRLMDLPFDTTLHYAAIHLHPFAESLELRDLTDGRTVVSSKTRWFPDRIGLEHIDHFSSREGIPLYRNHEYELVSVYNNTTDADQDSMAVMYLYLLDRAMEAVWQ